MLIAANWKMNLTTASAREIIRNLEVVLPGEPELLLCVSATLAGTVLEYAQSKNIGMGLQNMHWAESGAYTGEISAKQVKDAGATHVIIGHSERREMFGEDDAMVNRKVKSAQKHGILPIVCVGESLADREGDRWREVLQNQLAKGLEDVSPRDVIIAYEPVWAIGTGRAASPAQVAETMSWISADLRERFGIARMEIQLLYGGSVKPENIAELGCLDGIDGFLVGGASLCHKSLKEMLQKLTV